ncbi:MAG: cation:proton antiporter [Candidatus Aenigmatarchaeota archaeon]
MLGIIGLSIFLGSFFSSRIGLPLFVTLLFVGSLIGPHGIKLIEESETLNQLAELGTIFLLFLIGAEFPLNKIITSGFSVIFIALIEIFSCVFIFFQVFKFLNFGFLEALFLSISFSITSTAISFKIIENLNAKDRKEIPTIIGISVIEDLATIFLLGIFISLFSNKTVITIDNLLWSIFKSLFTIVVVYHSLTKLLSFVFSKYTLKEEERLAFGVFLIALLISISSFVGLSTAFGAYLAGTIITSLEGGEKIEEIIRKFSSIFISIFFLFLGMSINFLNIFSSLNLIATITLIGLVGKLGSIFLSSLITGFSPAQAFFISSTMLPMGEVTLFLLKIGADNNIISSEWLGIGSLTVLISTFISYFMLTFNRQIFFLFEMITPKLFKKIGKDIYRFGLTISKILYPPKTFLPELSNISLYLSIIVLTAIGLFVFRTQFLFELISSVSIIIVLYSIGKISKSWKRLKLFCARYNIEISPMKNFLFIFLFSVVILLISLLIEEFIRISFSSLIIVSIWLVVLLFLIVRITKKYRWKITKEYIL